MAGRLQSFRILILETREEAQFTRLLREQGAEVLQCPMFSIEDAADPAPVTGWLNRQIRHPPDDLVLMTGEGLRRLMAHATRSGLGDQLVAALSTARIFARGPKPVKALREIALAPYRVTTTPTTAGIIEMLANENLNGRNVAVQLYPEKDLTAFLAKLTAMGARPDAVTPYRYDSRAADDNILLAIREMAARRINCIALTSSGQVRRLFDTAQRHDVERELRDALRQTPIASVGPVVTDELKLLGLEPDISPAEGSYFIRPLISAMASYLAKNS